MHICIDDQQEFKGNSSPSAWGFELRQRGLVTHGEKTFIASLFAWKHSPSEDIRFYTMESCSGRKILVPPQWMRKEYTIAPFSTDEIERDWLMITVIECDWLVNSYVKHGAWVHFDEMNDKKNSENRMALNVYFWKHNKNIMWKLMTQPFFRRWTISLNETMNRTYEYNRWIVNAMSIIKIIINGKRSSF